MSRLTALNSEERASGVKVHSPSSRLVAAARSTRPSSISTLSPDLFLYPINYQTMAASTKKRSDPLWASLASGTIAGAVEGAVTYPADFVKTQVQFHGQSGAKVSLPSCSSNSLSPVSYLT